MELVGLMSTTTRGHQVLSLSFIGIVRDTQETFEPLEHQQTIRTNGLRRSITTALAEPIWRYDQWSPVVWLLQSTSEAADARSITQKARS